MAKISELINGTCTQLLFSPKGGIEGALVQSKGETVQLTMGPHAGAAFARATSVGKRVRVLAVADHSPKTAESAHPVYQLESLADAAGAAVETTDFDPKNTTIKGTVATLHFAKHGQPNGVILETGEFIHLKPHGMTQAKLKVGSKVNAVGEVKMTVLGTRLLEARQINRIEL